MNRKAQTGVIITILVIIAVTFIVMACINSPYKGYKFNQKIGSYCELSYEASDIDKKIEYFDKCITKLNDEDYKGYAVWWFKKPTDKMSEMYAVANSLQLRMHNLQGMDKASFEYQKGLEQVEEEIQYFLGKGSNSISGGAIGNFKTAYCYKNTWTKYLC